MNLRECKSFAKQKNLDINLFSPAVFIELIADTFLIVAYCVSKHSWSFNNTLNKKVIHSLQNFRFFSIETFKLESTCWVAAPISIKNSTIWLSELLSQPSIIILVNVFASFNFFFLKINPSNQVETFDSSWYMNGNMGLPIWNNTRNGFKIPAITANKRNFAGINKSWWWVTKIS